MSDQSLLRKILAVIGVKLVILTLIWSFFFSDYKVNVTPQSIEDHFSDGK